MTKKIYLAQIDRYGYMLTSVGRTEAEARDAILKKYREAFRNDNGCDPSEELLPDTDLSYLELAKEELFVTPVEFGEVLWL